MSVESAADRLSFFETDEFAVKGLYVTAAGVHCELDILLDRPIRGIDATDGQVVTTGFSARVLQDQAAALTKGETLEIDGVNYTILSIEPDDEDITGEVRQVLLRPS